MHANTIGSNSCMEMPSLSILSLPPCDNCASERVHTDVLCGMGISTGFVGRNSQKLSGSCSALTHLLGAWGSPDRSNAAIGVCGERIKEKGPESSTNAIANYGRNLGGLATGVAAPSRVTGCSHAVGSGSNVFFLVSCDQVRLQFPKKEALRRIDIWQLGMCD